jgi:hypothetical protein
MATSDDTSDSSNGSSMKIEAAWRSLLDELHRLSSLEDDWDGAGAAAPDPRCVEAATRWIREMAGSGDEFAPPTRITVTPGGELLVVWQTDSEYLEAEIVSSTEVEWMQCAEGATPEHWSSGLGESVQRR